ncbi:MAG: GNAT family N-acetyltransferase [Planctomycetes bacterium]|nr:GNAT family N-acetyltransferase [Planctomycetota bacterium]
MTTERTDGRIRIRPAAPGDAGALYEAIRESIPEISRWASWCGPDYSLADAEGFLATRAMAWSKGMAYDFVILDAEGGALLGGCGLNQFNAIHRFANLGYWVRSSRTGRGIATAAARLLARFGFEALDLHRIEIVASVGNGASQRVAQKAGATREGMARNRHVVRDRIHDAVMYSLIPGDLGIRAEGVRGDSDG